MFVLLCQVCLRSHLTQENPSSLPDSRILTPLTDGLTDGLCAKHSYTYRCAHSVDGSCDFCQKDRRGRGRINNMIDRRPWASLTWRAEERESQYPTVSHKEKSIYCIQRKEKLTRLYTWLINMLLITSDLKAVVINLMPAQPPLFCSQCFHQMLDLLQGFVHERWSRTSQVVSWLATENIIQLLRLRTLMRVKWSIEGNWTGFSFLTTFIQEAPSVLTDFKTLRLSSS